MEQDVSAGKSRVPSHLKPLLRPSLTTEPVLTQDHALGVEVPAAKQVELCPPHWRLEPKRSLGSTLKSLILKEWPLPKPTTPPRSISAGWPGIMRMKDSDDYITARAANPRTGLISPSVGTLTPRLLETPGSPGEALSIKPKESPTSPTPEAKERPALKRANEGRKISAGSKKLWRPDGHGWLMEAPVTSASPRFTDTQVEVDMVGEGQQGSANEDLFVVHMPSAQEPQPYAYPGYSAKQIEAAEFYKRKARRVSNEGYDKRMLHGSRNCSFESKPCHTSGIRKESSRRKCQKPTNSEFVHAGEADSPVYHGGHIVVAKRRIGRQEFTNEDIEKDCKGGADLLARTFSPFESPKTPRLRAEDASATEMQTSKPQRHRGVSDSHRIQRKPVNRLLESPYHTVNLKTLPQIALVHPALAALPKSHPHRQRVQQDGDRKCSFGCAKDPDSDVCVERRTPSTSTVSTPVKSLFDQRSRSAAHVQAEGRSQENGHYQEVPPLMEHLAVAIISILDACRYVAAPIFARLTTIDALRADQTPQQKMEAMRRMLSTTGQAMVLMALAAMLWHVGSTVKHVVERVL